MGPNPRTRSGRITSCVVTTIESVRARFTALQQPLAFFDGPGGTQVPDTVIDAIAGYLRASNANVGGAFATSRRSDALLAEARGIDPDPIRREPGSPWAAAAGSAYPI